MKSRVHSYVGSGLVAVGLVAASGCSAAPTSPAGVSSAAAIQTTSSSPASGSSLQSVMKKSTVQGTFPLSAGTFQIANGAGDSISGTYAGTAVFSSNGPEKAALTLQISGGTGAFAGASGTALATGTGGFADEGAFTIDARGDVAIAGGKHAQITLSLSGTSRATCSDTSQIAITQTADGNMARAGHVHGTFDHVVGNTGCIP
jgi:hypothetical protein